MKVLLSAYACEPRRGSEPHVGWNAALALAKHHRVWVITRAKSRQAIEKAFRQNRLPGISFVYVDLPKWARFWKDFPGGLYLYYYVWQFLAYFKARKLHREIKFDRTHHVTFGTYWLPSFLPLLPAPFIWGPVGGGESSPLAFRSSFGWRGRAYEMARDFVRNMSSINPFVRLTARRAILAMATTEETAARLRALGCRHIQVTSQVALSRQDIQSFQRVSRNGSRPFRIVSAGRLLHWKGFHLSLKAMARLKTRVPACEYWLFGDGPERKRLEQLAADLGLDNVKFWSHTPRQQVMDRLAECDVLVHPSLHDSGGFICAEAMAAGRPVICLDLGGPAIQVTQETGIKIPALSPGQVVSDLADALETLARDPLLRSSLGEAGRRRIEESIAWDREMAGLDEARSYAQRSQAV